MGFLSNMRGMKGLVDDAGGMPTLRGAYHDMAALTDDRGERETLQTGAPARAIARGSCQMVPGDRFAMRLPLEVHPPDGTAPYTVDYIFPVARMRAGLSMGMEVPVKIHPDDAQRIAVQWDALQASIAAAGGAPQAIQAGLQETYRGQTDEAYREARIREQAEDPVTKLMKLGQLRDAGLITQAEFDTKRTALAEEL